ncbi:hypothetical protein EUTSA_v100233390mg, partial [Eutrema salsugineum]
REMPINVGKLRRLLKSKFPYIERNIDAVVSVIRRAMQNAAAFEQVVHSLKTWRLEPVFEKTIETTIQETGTEAVALSPNLKEESKIGGVSTTSLLGSEEVSVDVSKKQSSGFGALPSKRKFESDNKAKEEVKLSKSKANEVIIVVDDDDEETSETDAAVDRLSETTFKGPDIISMTLDPKTCGPDIIVLDDDDSDDEDSDDEDSDDDDLETGNGTKSELKG